MNVLAEKALEILKSSAKDTFTNSLLMQNGFSKSEAKTALDELENEGLICIDQIYVSGNKSYKFN